MPVDIQPKWWLIVTFFLAYHMLGRWTNRILVFWLISFGLNGFLSFFIISILEITLLLETLVKFLIFQSVKPPRFEATKVENWPYINLDALTYYTNELQQLGFTILGDYTAPSIKGMMRLFAHPEFVCFAQVGQLTGHQIFCTISSELEADWGMSATNLERNADHACLRLPRKIHRYVANATPTVLLETLLDWRSQVIKDLSVQPLKTVSVELFFAQSRQRYLKIRHRLLWSSIVWRQLETFLYKQKHQTDWLGDYPKLKLRVKAN